MTVLLFRETLKRAVARAQGEWLDKPVTWGRDDCALACADILRPVLGYDPAAQWRGRYTTPLGYRRVLKKDGLGSVDAAIASVAREHGWEPIEPAEAQAGDVGIAPHPEGRTVFVADGNGFWIARAEKGFAARPACEIETAWSVSDA